MKLEKEKLYAFVSQQKKKKENNNKNLEHQLNMIVIFIRIFMVLFLYILVKTDEIPCLYTVKFILYSSLMNSWIYNPLFTLLIFMSEKLYFVEAIYTLAVYLKQQGGIVIIFLFLNSILFLGVEIYHNYSSQIKRKSEIKLWFLLIEVLIIFCILTTNILFFYIAFELTLLTFFYLVYILGSQSRRIHAINLLIFYTMFGSIFLLMAIVLIFYEYGTFYVSLIDQNKHVNVQLDKLIFFLLLAGFGVKIPIFPLHLWLLEAHVEAHTTTSVILAGIILKLGGIGMLKFMLSFAYAAKGSIFLSIAIAIVAMGTLLCGLAAIAQLDMKRIVAYCSVIHMNLSVLSFLLFNEDSVMASVLSMFGHGLTAGGLFFCIGMVYERYGTRNKQAFGGLVTFMPNFSLFFFLLLLTNASFPLSINFVAEMYTFLGIQQASSVLNIFLLLFISITVILSFWLIVRVIFGNRFIKNTLLGKVQDLVFYEIAILGILISFNLLFGFYVTPELVATVKTGITFVK